MEQVAAYQGVRITDFLVNNPNVQESISVNCIALEAMDGKTTLKILFELPVESFEDIQRINLELRPPNRFMNIIKEKHEYKDSFAYLSDLIDSLLSEGLRIWSCDLETYDIYDNPKLDQRYNRYSLCYAHDREIYWINPRRLFESLAEGNTEFGLNIDKADLDIQYIPKSELAGIKQFFAHPIVVEEFFRLRR